MGETVKTSENQNDQAQLGCASQWNLVVRRFARHRLAVFSAFMLLLLYAIAIFAEFVAPQDPNKTDVDFGYCPPQVPQISLAEGLYVHPMEKHLDPVTLEYEYVENRDKKIELGFFVKGDPYELWGLIPMRRHLIGVANGGTQNTQGAENKATVARSQQADTFYLFGADKFGRDVFSRIVYGARISLSVGLVGVFISFILGCLIGGVSGFASGWVDKLIQRFIEILNAIPILPLWLVLAALMPVTWSPLTVYFAITVILSLFGWRPLAREVRGRIISMREQDYTVAAQLRGASPSRILVRHLLPGVTSHVLVRLTLAIPRMILGETALSFLGLGLRPPVVSWGVLLQDCMQMESVVNYYWLLLPVFFIILAVMCFNFIGDGLRDAADPYH